MSRSYFDNFDCIVPLTTMSIILISPYPCSVMTYTHSYTIVHKSGVTVTVVVTHDGTIQYRFYFSE